MAPFAQIVIILIIVNCFQYNWCIEHLWHSHFDLIHENREEFVITNATSDNKFELNFKVDRWKSLAVGKSCYVVGSNHNHLILAVLNEQSGSFTNKSSVLDVQSKINDFVIFQWWNSTERHDEIILIVAMAQFELVWFKIENLTPIKFWSWSLQKSLIHINYFQIDFNDHLLVITQYLNQTTADLYEFNLDKQSNFWLRQSIELFNTTKASALTNFGPDYFLSIPQKSLNSLLIYKLIKNHFVPYKNLTSDYIDDVVTFEIGSKCFIAFNGDQAGIYRFSKNELIKENLFDSHFSRILYWLPIILKNRDDVILLAQRWLDHSYHYSAIIDVIVYNGIKFVEHEDISCLYFGEHTNTLSCLTEHSRYGIRGAAPIIIGDKTGMLRLTDNGTSELFWFNMQLRRVPNPIQIEVEKFQHTQKRLDSLLKSQIEEFEKIKNLPTIPDDHQDLEFLQIQVDDLETKVNKIKDNLKQIENHENLQFYDTIIFNDLVEIHGDCNTDIVTTEKLNGVNTETVFSDIVERNSTKRVSGGKFFENLQINHLYTDQINDIRVENLVFQENGSLDFSGNLTIQQSVIAEEATIQEINGLIFENEITRIDDTNSTLENVIILQNFSTETLNEIPLKPDLNTPTIDWNSNFDTLYIPENVEVVNVNGENFQDFRKQLCLTNIESYIPGDININGDVIIAADSTIDYLNGVKFPEGLVFSDDKTTKITGHKVFPNQLKIHEIRCNGSIDQIKPDEIITLTTEQSIAGKLIFENLEISESLNIFGNLNGLNATNLVKSRTLIECRDINSKVNFKKLEVNGSIIVKNRFNGENFTNLLENIVYTVEDNIVITSLKEFPEGFSIHNNLNLHSNSINYIHLNSLLTKNHQQILNFNKLNGNVTIANLELKGLYNSIDAQKLDDETVKLTGEQYISSTLIFNNNLEADHLEIIETLNDISPENLLPENSQIENRVQFNSLIADILEIHGDIVGNFTNFDIIDLDRRHLSLNGNQRISGNYKLAKSQIAEVYPEKINNFDTFKITDQGALRDKIIGRLSDGGIAIKNIHVNGSLKIDQINGDNLMNLGGILFEDGLKHYRNLTFRNNVIFEKLTINQYNNRDYNEIIDNVIYKNETAPIIKGLKWFNRGITIGKLLETQRINEIPIDKIFRKHGEQQLNGPIEIVGNVTIVNNITIDEINNVSMELITKNYEKIGDNYQINGNVIFNRLARIENLQIHSYLDSKNVEEHLNSIILTRDNFEISNETIFENKVRIGGNLTVNRINDLNLAIFLGDVIMINDDNSIQVPVEFLDPIVIDSLQLTGDIQTKLINNQTINELLNQAIFIDRGLIKGNYSFETVEIVGNLTADFINKINTSRLIPLKIEQNLTELSIDKLTSLNDIEINKLFNGLNLLEESQNTFVVDVDQEIVSNLLFKNHITITGNTTIEHTINNRNISKIVTTDTDQNLTTNYNFAIKQIIDKNLQIYGNINDINLTNWQEQTLKIYSNESQIIINNWNLDSDMIFESNTNGDVLVNSLNLEKLKRDVDKKRRFKYKVEKQLIADYKQICNNLSVSYEQTAQQMYKFDYLDQLQSFNFSNPINYFYSFQFRNKHYLVIDEIGICVAHVLVWNNSKYLPVKDVDFGEISQIISATSDNYIFLIVRNRRFSACQPEGTNIWSLDEFGNFKHLLNMENQDLLQDSAIPGTFYGLTNGIVNEFFIYSHNDPVLRKVRKWEIHEDNMAFIPRDLRTGLAIRTGRKLLRLDRSDQSSIDLDLNAEFVINANFTSEWNRNFPGYDNNDLIVIKVGTRTNQRNLLVIASQEDTLIKSSSYDFIKIYEDPINGRLLQKIPTFQPSSLISLEFGNGETLLGFLEDRRVLQIFEYKGIEGFKYRSSTKIKGSKLFTIILPGTNCRRFILGVIDHNLLHLVEALMLGNQIDGHLKCLL